MAESSLSENMNNCKVEEKNSAEDNLDTVDGFRSFLRKRFEILCTSFSLDEETDQDHTEKKPGSPSKSDMASDSNLDQECYDFDYPKRGLAVIINNEDFSRSKEFGDRPGSSYDAKSLYKSFHALGFDVELYHDLPAWKMVEVLRAAATRYDHSTADCFACSILSHGDQTWSEREWDRLGTTVRMDLLFGTDGKALATKALVEMFDDQNCPSLKNKPRLFFLQACRGDKYDDGQTVYVKKSTPSLRKLGGGGDSRDGDAKDGTKDETDRSQQKTLSPPTTVERQTSLSSSVDPPEYNQPRDSTDAQAASSGGVKDETDASGGDQGDGECGDDNTDALWHSISNLPVSPAPVYHDCLIMYATPPGFFAWRRRTGAWFIQCLCKLFDSNVLDHVSLIRGLSYVCGKVAREYQSENPNNPTMHHKKEVPVVESKLIKEVFMKRKPSGQSPVPRYH